MKATKTSEYFAQYALIILGSVLFAAGFQFFLYPNSIIVGGVSGIAMIINYLTALPVGVMTIILNIPLFIIAWRHFGTKFIIASLVGMLLSSVLVDVFALIKILSDERHAACLHRRRRSKGTRTRHNLLCRRNDGRNRYNRKICAPEVSVYKLRNACSADRRRHNNRVCDHLQQGRRRNVCDHYDVCGLQGRRSCALRH